MNPDYYIEEIQLNNKLIRIHEIKREQSEQAKQRVQQIIKKTQSRMKLVPNNRERQFNEKIKQLKNIKTFVDVHKKIQSLNVIDDPDFIQSARHTRSTLFNQFFEMQQSNYQDSKGHQELYDQSDISDTDRGDPNLVLAEDHITREEKNHFITQNQIHQHGCELIRISKNKLKESALRHSQKFNRESNNELFNDDKHTKENANLNAGLEFYSTILSDQSRSRKVKPKHRFQKSAHEINKQIQNLDGFLMSNGIELEVKERVPNQKYLENYGIKSSRIIRQSLVISKQAQSPSRIDELTQLQRGSPGTAARLGSFKSIDSKRSQSRRQSQVEFSPGSPSLGGYWSKSPSPRIQSMRFVGKGSDRRGSQIMIPMNSMTQFTMDDTDTLNSQMDRLTMRIRRTERDFKVEHPHVIRQLQSMDREMIDTSYKYKDLKSGTIIVEPQQVIDYIEDSQKVFRSDLFRKKKY